MAAAARPYWTGFLKLSLVTIAVRLSPRARGAVPE
jgi:non-homologous end joining protein Ku